MARLPPPNERLRTVFHFLAYWMLDTMALLFVLGALSALPMTYAHMQMIKPSPFRDPHADRTEPKDWNILNPLRSDGSDFACKGYRTRSGLQRLEWKVTKPFRIAQRIGFRSAKFLRRQDLQDVPQTSETTESKIPSEPTTFDLFLKYPDRLGNNVIECIRGFVVKEPADAAATPSEGDSTGNVLAKTKRLVISVLTKRQLLVPDGCMELSLLGSWQTIGAVL
ncbi:hypothetical protein GQ44DRAFT_774436 [Phaeosphaeriaceae sp. PMI808]|nr:hypothetical protein GQ44DRAFT_774436 [Phaeosphaeriaceae sp. PMI808]